MKSNWLRVGGILLCVGLIVGFIVNHVFDGNAKNATFAAATPLVPRAKATADAALQMLRRQSGTQPIAGSTPLNPTATGNPLETARDLRVVYDSLKDSVDPVARNIAHRAWSACFPTFISPQGKPLSLDRILKALPATAANNEARRAAYRGLHERCAGFFQLSREEAMYTTQLQQDASNKGESLAPGEFAAKLLRDGDTDGALDVARTVIASRDAYAIASLQDFVHHYLVLQIDAQPKASNERADIRALAFQIAACQMGLECGSDSLTALQLCANGGQCDGTVVDRYLQALPNITDRETVMKESQRIGDAILSGNLQALGLAPIPG